MCLYDVDLIMQVWAYISEDASLQSYMGLSAFHYSLTLCARLVASGDLSAQVRTIVICIVLYCIVLYCIVLYCIVLYCIAPLDYCMSIFLTSSHLI